MRKIRIMYLFLLISNIQAIGINFLNPFHDSKNKTSKDLSKAEEMFKNVWNKIHTPGHWTSWGEWICDAICGQGIYFRKRICIGTGEFGIPVCKGNEIDRKGSNCSIACPTIEYIKSRIFGKQISTPEKKFYDNLLETSNAFSFRRNPGEKIRFDCNNNFNKQILITYPGSVLFWNKNGLRFWYDFRRIKLEKFTILEINNLTANDTGVYTCNVMLSKNQLFPILPFALTVIDETSNRSVYLNEKIAVTCNSQIIGQMYPNLRAKWVIEETGIEIKNYASSSSVAKINSDEIENLREEFSGVWSCVLNDRLKNTTWITNSFRVQILPPSIFLFTFLNHYFSAVTICAITILSLVFISVTSIASRIVQKKRRTELLAELGNVDELYREYVMRQKTISKPTANVDATITSKDIKLKRQDSFEEKIKNVLKRVEIMRRQNETH